MKAAGWQQRGRSSDFIEKNIQLKLKKINTLLFYICISELRIGGYFLKTCFLIMELKKS